MRSIEDKTFDLAIVDPPYGTGQRQITNGPTRKKIAPAGNFKPYDNRKPPSREYFAELIRVSKNQIIFGANHFAGLFNSSSPGWVIWDKLTTGDFADCELAYTSFDCAAKKYTYMWNGCHQGQFGGDKSLNEVRIHPSQKPVKLYEWLLNTFAKPNQLILDTHLGSGSSAVAAHYFGCDFVGCELDPEYYENALNRLNLETKQMRLITI